MFVDVSRDVIVGWVVYGFIFRVSVGLVVVSQVVDSFEC